MEGSKRAEALLGATSAGTQSLLLGVGCERLAEVIPRLGGRAVIAAMAFAENGGDDRGVMRVRLGAPCQLPFGDCTFDSVFVPSSETLRPDQRDPVRPQRELHVDLLHECRRVLKPGGRLFISMPNARGVGLLLRWSSGLSAVSLLPRRLRQRVRNLASSAPLAKGYGRAAAMRLLREAGFPVVQCYVPWPQRAYWKVLVPAARTRGYSLPHASQWDEATRAVMSAAVRLRLHEQLIIEYCYVAERRAEAVVRDAEVAVLDQILGRTGVRHPPSREIVLHDRSDRIATFISAGRFVKIAFGPVQAQRFAWERQALDRVRRTAAAGFMIDYITHGSIHAVPYTVFPAAEVPTYGGEIEKCKTLDSCFDLLAGSAYTAGLQDTDAWRRILSSKSLQELARLGGNDVVDRFAATCADRKVRVGLVHGDLHVDNILRRGGEPALIDWDRFEQTSPLLLDRCNAVAQLLVSRAIAREEPAPRLRALERLAARRSDTPLLLRLQETAGELTWEEMVALYILSLASWAAIQDITRLSPSAEERIRQELALCRRCLDSRLSADVPSERPSQV